MLIKLIFKGSKDDFDKHLKKYGYRHFFFGKIKILNKLRKPSLKNFC